MIAIQMPVNAEDDLLDLIDKHPELLSKNASRPIDGTISELTIFISAAAFLIPEIRKVATEIIINKRHKSITYKGITIQGHSSEEIKKIISDIENLNSNASKNDGNDQ